jgi:hypothetical protein
MNRIDDEGFLSQEVDRYLNECRSRYAAWFQLVQSINRLGQSLLGEVRMDQDDPQHSIAGLLFVRVLSHAQGAVLLIERCMPTQGEVLCRASLEALFGLLAVAEKADTAMLLVKADRYHRQKLLEAKLRLSDLPGHNDLDAATQRQIACEIQLIKEDLERDPSPQLNTLELAKRADQLALYESAYRLLSLPVHSNLRDLERQLGFNDEGKPTSVGWGPNLDGLDHLLMTVAETLLRAVATMCCLFTLGHEEELKALRDRYVAQALSVVEAT